jgi:hypothetical protein
MSKENQEAENTAASKALPSSSGSDRVETPQHLDEYWRQVGECHRTITSHLNAGGYNGENIRKEYHRLGQIMEDGLKFYSQNDQSSRT